MLSIGCALVFRNRPSSESRSVVCWIGIGEDITHARKLESESRGILEVGCFIARGGQSTRDCKV